MRAALGEVSMLDEVHPGRFSYPEIAIGDDCHIHDLFDTGGQTLEDLLGPHPSTASAAVDAGGGLPPAVEPPATVATGSSFEGAAVSIAIAARAIWMAIQNGSGGG
jgi:hypothetical protein